MICSSIFSPEQQEISEGDEEKRHKVKENEKHGVSPSTFVVTIREKRRKTNRVT